MIADKTFDGGRHHRGAGRMRRQGRHFSAPTPVAAVEHRCRDLQMAELESKIALQDQIVQTYRAPCRNRARSPDSCRSRHRKLTMNLNKP